MSCIWGYMARLKPLESQCCHPGAAAEDGAYAALRQPYVSHDARRCVRASVSIHMGSYSNLAPARAVLSTTWTMFRHLTPPGDQRCRTALTTVRAQSNTINNSRPANGAAMYILAHSDALRRPCSAAVLQTQPMTPRRPPSLASQTWLLDSSPARLELLDT